MKIILLPTVLTVGLMATFMAPGQGPASVRQEIPGDLYATSNAVIVAAPVRGDIFAAGDSVDISGTSDESVFAIGRSVTVSGAVKDDVRIAGSSVSLTSEVAHDVFAAGSSVFVGTQSTVGGDVYLAGNDITIAGTIKGTLRVAGERVTIAKTAVISGDVIAYQNKPSIEDGATITGTVKTITQPIGQTKSNMREGVGSFVRSAVSHSLLALALLWIAPLFVKNVIGHATSTPTQTGLLGLVVIILFFPLTIILSITGIGVYVAMLVLTGSLFCIVLGIGTSIVFLGTLLGKFLFAKASPSTISWQHAFIGGVAAAIISLTGGLGFIALFILFLIGLGAAVKSLKEIVYG